jgi:hypothetical protein
MTTFAGQMDFDCPQPNNMDAEPAEVDMYAKRQPLEAVSVPVVAQVIEAEQNLYGPVGQGVRGYGALRQRRVFE